MAIYATETYVEAGNIIKCTACDKRFQLNQSGKVEPCPYCKNMYYEYDNE